MSPTRRGANRHGLSRDIPEPVARIVRQNSGYGCIVCGDAICQYEHVDPEFCDAKSHDPTCIVLLCGSCHDKVTRGVWSKDKIKKAQASPFCKSKGKSQFCLDFSNKLAVQIGSGIFQNPMDIVRIDGKPVLAIHPAESEDSPPLLSAIFCDRTGKKVAWIDRNVWNGSPEAFDINCKGRHFNIRSKQNAIDLAIEFVAQHTIKIHSIYMSYRGVKIRGRPGSRFSIETSTSELAFPSSPFTVTNAKFCVVINGETIIMSVDPSIEFWNTDGVMPHAIVLVGGRLEFLSCEEAQASGDADTHMESHQKLLRVTNHTKERRKIGIAPMYPHPSGIKDQNIVTPIWIERALPGSRLCVSSPMLKHGGMATNPIAHEARRVPPNSLCPCGSMTKYKKCRCGLFRRRFGTY